MEILVDVGIEAVGRIHELLVGLFGIAGANLRELAARHHGDEIRTLHCASLQFPG